MDILTVDSEDRVLASKRQRHRVDEVFTEGHEANEEAFCLVFFVCFCNRHCLMS